MSGRLDRLIARVVEGRHEIRVGAPTIFEGELAKLEEWPGEINKEIVAVPLGTISRDQADPTHPDPLGDLVQPSATDERRPPAQPKRPHDVKQSNATPADRRRPQRRLAPSVPVDETERGLTVEGHVAIPIPRAASLPSPAGEAVGRREQALTATRRVPDRAPPEEPRPAEPNRITIEIGRIDVGAPPPLRERMLSLDAYRAARRDGTR